MKVVFYDGDCAVCGGFVGWVSGRSSTLFFAPLSGEYARRIIPLDYYARECEEWEMGYHTGDRLLFGGEAVFSVLKELGGVWKLLGMVGGWFPKPLVEMVYRFFAKRRRLIRGVCVLPSEDLRARILL